MNRKRNQLTAYLASAIVLGVAVAPGASAADDTRQSDAFARTATELGQAVGEPGEAAGASAGRTYERTATELGQAVGEPGEAAGTQAGTAGDRASLASNSNGAGGFDWGAAVIAAGGALALLIGAGGAVVLIRRKAAVRRSRTPAVSS